MRFFSTLLAIAPLLLTVRADIDLDLDDTPSVCRDTCRPIAQLADRCHVDLDGDDDDRQEDLLEAQCFCTNESFDVEATAALCHDCIRQNYNSTSNDWDDDNHDHDDHHDGDDSDDDHDHDDHHDDDNTRRAKRDHDGNDDHDDSWDDIRDIVRTCSFSSTSWSPSSTSATQTISVSADRPTDASQLTTTFSAATQTGTNSPIQTNGPDSNNNSNNDDDDNDDDNDDDDDGSAAAGLASPLMMVGALVVGAAALLA